MERWVGHVALVTGASAGIGAQICRSLVRSGLKVIGAARGVDRIEKLAQEIGGEKGSLTAIKCDITKDSDIYEMFDTVKKNFGGVDICINNAGMSFNNSLLDGSPDEWRQMLDVNVVGLCLCTKLTIASMRERGVDDGHVINISSISGHRVTINSNVHFYAATKHAVRALSEGLRQELREVKSHIRVSSVSPGIVETEFSERMNKDPEKARKIYGSLTCLQAEDVASSVLHIISSPPHVEINDMIIRPTEQTL